MGARDSRCRPHDRLGPVLALLPLFLILAGAPAAGQDWPYYGGDAAGRSYSSLSDIDRANVSRLEVAWSWNTDEEPFREEKRWWQIFREVEERQFRAGRFEATPIMVNDTLYLSTPFNRVAALDAETGRMLWSFDPRAHEDGWLASEFWVHRGVAQWSDGRTRRIFLNSRSDLIALDAATGRRVTSFGRGGEVSLVPGLRWPAAREDILASSPPVVFDSLVIVGFRVNDTLVHHRDPPGAVQAFDVRTGERAWAFHTIPGAGEPGSETWGEGAHLRTGHVNVWAPMALDEGRGLLYVPVSAASNDHYGGGRPGDNLYSQSLLCLDARTGERRWHFQIVHHDLWDYDPAAPPVLMELPRGDSTVDAVALAGKTGFLYVFDRVDGEPLWPMEERPVPPSDVPGEITSPTQPFPTRPPPFARQGFDTTDVVDFTPEIRAAALEKIREYRLGPLFTPPSERGTVVMPGWRGGAAWGGTAFDPETSTLYVKATNKASVVRLVRSEGFGTGPDFRVAWSDMFGDLEIAIPAADEAEDHTLRLPLNKPPYGTLTAIDLVRGEIRWQIPLGDSPHILEQPVLRDLDLPALGVDGTPGALVTGGGIVFVSGGSPTLYAVDKDSGEVLWTGDLGQPGEANPMTYRTRSGRQYIVIATGAGGGARLVAFALPRDQAP